MENIYNIIEVQFLKKYNAFGKRLGWPESWVPFNGTHETH